MRSEALRRREKWVLVVIAAVAIPEFVLLVLGHELGIYALLIAGGCLMASSLFLIVLIVAWVFRGKGAE